MIHRLYIVLVLSLLVSFTGNTQSTNEEPSLDKIQDATSDVKKYDLINYQIIADQKYFRNNPDALIKESSLSLEEQVSRKSADESAYNKGINANQSPLDEGTRSYSSTEGSLDTKSSESAEERFERKAGGKESEMNSVSREENSKKVANQSSETKSTSNTDNAKTSNSTNSTAQTTSKSGKKEVTNESKKSPGSLAIPAKKEKLIVKNVVDSTKLKAVKELVNAPFIQLNDNHKATNKQKSTQLTKNVQKTVKQVEIKNTYPESDREDQVVDELINSGNYDVYDDGKYIKFSKKK
jgi:hypothetical protein